MQTRAVPVSVNMGTKRTNHTGRIETLTPQGAKVLKTFICRNPSYLVIKFAMFCPLVTDIWQKCDFTKVMTLKGQAIGKNKGHHRIP